MHSDSERVRLRSLAVRPAAAGRGGRRPPLPLGRLGEAAARGGALDVGRLLINYWLLIIINHS